MKILSKTYQQMDGMLDWTVGLDWTNGLLDGINRTGISDHGDFSFDSIENKVTRTMKGGFYFTIAYNKE